ncbi:methyltransferase [Zobellella maritima]|uniref:methyltransferase n=1 Tax=Zobellella maritima TaxID=2059725 RepID=UPI000E3097F9|nr:methyltransferase [Zobellella maritima]
MSDLAPLFQDISRLLRQYHGDWQRYPFACTELPWSEWAEHLNGLDEAAVDALEADDEAKWRFCADIRPEVAAINRLTLPALNRPQDTGNPRWSNGIPGRKWAQIRDFASCISLDTPFLEWCAGKGHLGRLLAIHSGRPVLSLERDPVLCRQGEELAEKLDIDHQFVCDDALGADAHRLFKEEQQALALHACGELHLQFLRHGVRAGTRSLTLSPCCYHLIPQANYAPLSRLGRQLDLGLDRQDLRLPLQQQVTGGVRVRRLRHLELTWRLAFDELQRALRGCDSYLPLPSFAKRLLSGEFADFAAWACAEKGLALPPRLDSAYWLARAERRRLLVKRIELVRHLYRYPLELWLLLDRALFLLEQGYRVSLGTFTEQLNTPRRYLIRAMKS